MMTYLSLIIMIYKYGMLKPYNIYFYLLLFSINDINIPNNNLWLSSNIYYILKITLKSVFIIIKLIIMKYYYTNYYYYLLY